MLWTFRQASIAVTSWVIPKGVLESLDDFIDMASASRNASRSVQRDRWTNDTG